MSVRSSGLLLHPTSLPSSYGIGDLGPMARRFADFLQSTGQAYWQMLPLNPTEGAHGHSPYHSLSAFAGNPLLISPEGLAEQGLLKRSEVEGAAVGKPGKVTFGPVVRLKRRLLRRACERFDALGDTADYRRFCEDAGWLDDFAFYTALRERYHPAPWYEWPLPLREREPTALQDARRSLRDRIRHVKIVQYIFFRQWFELKRYCNRRMVRLIGDLPIYVPLDSADVWANRRLFKLARSGRPTAVSGVPPDYFSDTGQLWGHPVYDWEALRREDFDWWVLRAGHCFDLYDLTRFDHFRGLVAYWEVPAGSETAVEGDWVTVPVAEFLDRLVKRFGRLPVIAEDLGTIGPGVREVMRRYDLPGMRVLLFAFGEDFPNGAFLPHNHDRECVVYTGTHDNNTVRGWFEREADAATKRNLFRYLGGEVPTDRLHWELIRMAMMSTAATVIIPLQDILGLGAEARMNRPARRRGNWQWRFGRDALDPATAARLRAVTETYGRCRSASHESVQLPEQADRCWNGNRKGG